MTLTNIQARLLVVLFDLAQADRPANVRRIAEVLEVRLGEVATQLNELDRLGLVRAARVRLTFPGLAIAAAQKARLRARGVCLPLAA
jgi:Mn-dependent DtxR family transcriptional regulator